MRRSRLRPRISTAPLPPLPRSSRSFSWTTTCRILPAIPAGTGRGRGRARSHRTRGAPELLLHGRRKRAVVRLARVRKNSRRRTRPRGRAALTARRSLPLAQSARVSSAYNPSFRFTEPALCLHPRLTPPGATANSLPNATPAAGSPPSRRRAAALRGQHDVTLRKATARSRRARALSEKKRPTPLRLLVPPRVLNKLSLRETAGSGVQRFAGAASIAESFRSS